MDYAVRLLNQRGRVVTVEEKDVPGLLGRGFRYPPDNQTTSYNHIYDQGGDQTIHAAPLPLTETKKINIANRGPVLDTETI